MHISTDPARAAAATLGPPEFLPFNRPWFGDEEAAQLRDALESGWLTRGPKTAQFEAVFGDYIGAKAVGVNSATSGLHLALGIVAALYQRLRTGRSQRVLCAMQNGALNLARVKLRDRGAHERQRNRDDDCDQSDHERVLGHCLSGVVACAAVAAAAPLLAARRPYAGLAPAEAVDRNGASRAPRCGRSLTRRFSVPPTRKATTLSNQALNRALLSRQMLLRRGSVTRSSVLRVADLEVDRLSQQVSRRGRSSSPTRVAKVRSAGPPVARRRLTASARASACERRSRATALTTVATHPSTRTSAVPRRPTAALSAGRSSARLGTSVDPQDPVDPQSPHLPTP